MDKEIVFIPKEMKEQLQKIEDGVIEQHAIKDIIANFNRQIKMMDEELDESTMLFRHHAKKVKEKYKEVVDVEIESMNELWETLDQKRYEVSKKLNGLHERIRTTKDDLRELKKMTESIGVYGLTELIQLIDKVKYMNPRDKELLQYVFSHGKRE